VNDTNSAAAKRLPVPILHLKRRAIPRPRTARLKAAVREAVLRAGRRCFESARRLAHRLDKIGRPKGLVSYTPRQIRQGDIIKDISAATGFSYDATRSQIAQYETLYPFVPVGSITFHLNRRFNVVRLAALTADVVLFPSSHPLLFFPEQQEFIFDKHHEIPYHWKTEFLYLSSFSFMDTVRPNFVLDTNIYNIGNIFEIDEEVIYLGGSFNYGHFFTDCFPRFEALVAAMRADPQLAAQLPRAVVVYCEKGEFDFLERTFPEYSFLNLRGHEFSVIRIQKMYLATYVAFPLGIHLLRRGFAERRRQAEPTPARPAAPLTSSKRIFLSRQGFKRRRIANEDELITTLRQRGFLCVSAIDYSIEQLAEILNGADTLVAGMGAHTTNAVFLRPGSTFIELVPASFDANQIWQYNHSLFLCSELRYVRFVVADSERSGRGAETADTGIFDWEGVVDLPKFLECLDRYESFGAASAALQNAAPEVI
jgi:hypothetical protein